MSSQDNFVHDDPGQSRGNLGKAEKILFILPNAIGDVICGLGVAHQLRHSTNLPLRNSNTGDFAKLQSDPGHQVANLQSDGVPLTWLVNPSARDILAREPFELISPPSAHLRRMSRFGAPTEILWRETEKFLEQLRSRGPFTRVVNPHLSRTASLYAGAVRAKIYKGPALGDTVVSDTWSDFFMSSINCGMSPEISVPARFSLIAGLSETAWPELKPADSTSPDDPVHGVAFYPGSGWPSKALGIDQAADLADRLGMLGPVTILGGPAEKNLLSEIRRRMTTSPDEFLPGDLGLALDRIKRAALVVTTDTWALHAASAARRPTLAILGPTRIFPWTTGGGGAAAISTVTEPSWRSDGDRSIEALAPAKIFEAAAAVFERRTLPEGEDFLTWDCSGEFAVPSRPLRQEGAARAVFAWARARAFCRVVKRYMPVQPIPRLRSAESFHHLYENIPGVMRRIQTDREDLLKTFQLFETTFPQEDAEKILDEWIAGTFEEIQKLASNHLNV